MKKRIISFMLLLGVLVAAVSGCGSSSSNTAKTGAATNGQETDNIGEDGSVGALDSIIVALFGDLLEAG